jgi:hypothetical protein
VEINMKAVILLFLMMPLICWAQVDSIQRKLDAEDLESERFAHELILQQQWISAFNRLLGTPRTADVAPSLDGMLVVRDSDLFQLTMLKSITTLRPAFINEWRGWAGTLEALAKTQADPQFRHLQLQALSFTLLANAGDFVDQDAKALAKQPPEARAEVTALCSADGDAFVDMVVPCWMWKTYSGLPRNEIDSYARPTKLDAPAGFYRIDTLNIDTAGLTMRAGKWLDKDGREVQIEKITAHTFYDVPVQASGKN